MELSWLPLGLSWSCAVDVVQPRGEETESLVVVAQSPDIHTVTQEEEKAGQAGGGRRCRTKVKTDERDCDHIPKAKNWGMFISDVFAPRLLALGDLLFAIRPCRTPYPTAVLGIVLVMSRAIGLFADACIWPLPPSRSCSPNQN
ncbi:hypothetical protein BDP67DRAFT_492327 [Colletotrichum lupini]|nr:hypothetical protein BDP67DRAFT_492327 [Colletotrichum lupini]